MWTLGPPAPETLARFIQLTAMGETEWVIVSLPSGSVEDLILPDGYSSYSSEEL
jgi:hypothetical protein